jgi:hypothetical protein
MGGALLTIAPVDRSLPALQHEIPSMRPRLICGAFLLFAAATASASPAQAPWLAYGPGHGKVKVGSTSHSKGWNGPGARWSDRSPVVIWIPGHYETVERIHWVPASTRREWVPAVTRRTCDPWGLSREVVIRPAGWVLVPVPGHRETLFETVWVPGHWSNAAY